MCRADDSAATTPGLSLLKTAALLLPLETGLRLAPSVYVANW